MSLSKAHILALFYTLFLATSLLLPASAFQKFTFTSLLELDKLIHFIIFFLFETLWLLAVIQKKSITSKTKAQYLIVGICYGVLLEFLQSTSAFERSFEYGDVIANTLGCILGVLSFTVVLKFVTFLKKYLPFMSKLYK
jgi:VanZ family protein